MSDTEIPDEIAPTEFPAQTLPLDGWHRAQGGRMVEFAGYHMPVQYEGIMAEHLWVRESAGLFDVSHMGQLVFRAEGGADVVAALEALLPADIAGLGENKQRYSLLLAENGGILDDLMVTHLPAASPFAVDEEAGEPAEPAGWSPLDASPTDPDAPTFYMVVNGATKIDDIAHLLEFLPDGIAINHLEEQALLALQGPKAVDALARLVPGVEAMVFMTAGAFDWNGVPLWISRSGYTGEDGFEISVPGEHVVALADALIAEPEVKPIGLGARDSLRLEAGLPLYGHDLDPDTTPVQADLGFALSKRRREAGDFMGAAPILAERAAGAASKRVGLLIAGRQPVREGATVVDDSGADIGRVTSGGFAPSVGAAIAMAYVPTELAAPGTTVTLSQRGKVHTATVTAMPFIPHRYVRAGGPK
ncbi:glycine cleavage system aminomethyltransferase GcvT [Sphingomonas glacialis]|uniref:Glycine cleavage system aminomethyltransferase GcvT n=1 Tax=Sphingomonas glacialis TaxID=658225 RepID=A0A502FZ87_9SPHN|nr:glycine cleavage system aminomethyltransferase GcvT [Sphingomonas glacialis]TPG54814.1 glycine cleavage system aminomethyltransferase GcvT [Sphingomonas glacialis]